MTAAREKPGAETYGNQALLPDIGAALLFSVLAFKHIPKARKYASEVLRQTGIIILSSSGIIWFMMGILAAEISLEGHYLLRQLGAGGYTAVFTAVSDYTVAPEMWGWILAAKVGCGLVAELGSMRISEEVDALEVMGIDSMAYLVSVRVLAVVIVTPFMFIAGTGIMYMVNYGLNVYVFESVTQGAYLSVFWAFLTQTDVLFSLTAGAVMGIMIVLVGCFYGYTASGGPVGVGKNTAKSMVINLIIVSVVGAIFQQLFFGGFTRAPIGN
jgi:phospholipid/cholesterol/gamma-HCH transport system permease protein